MKRTSLILMLLTLSVSLFAQSITLTFTGRDAQNQHVQLNHVGITNLTQNWQETIYYPDTILMMGGTGVDDFENPNEFKLSQNVPNPFESASDFELQMAEAGYVSLSVFDLTGRKITAFQGKLSAGIHVFRVILRNPMSYVLTARCGNHVGNIKIINNGQAEENAILYVGEGMSHGLNMLLKGGTTHPFSVGDEMRYVGYATINGIETMSLPIQKHQTVSEEIILVFDTAGVDDGQPCPYAATLTDVDGNVYNTVQIGNQCWMKENLRTTKYADGTSIEQGSTTSYDVAYWYYPNNDATNKDTYGLLYNWKAVMRSNPSSDANPSGVQGICPTGWHVPSDAEWTQLTDYVSSQSDYVCDGVQGNIAKSLASTTGWESSTETCAVGNLQSENNTTGFDALPASNFYGDYFNVGYYTGFWSATEQNRLYVNGRFLTYNIASVDIFGPVSKNTGTSVRCLRGEAVDELPAVSTLPVSDITATTAICGGNVTTEGIYAVTARGVCWSIDPNPTIENAHTSDGTGLGTFTSDLTDLTVCTTYYVRAYATNSAGTVYGEEITFITAPTSVEGDGQPCSNMTTVNDIDGNTYNTVQIGNQCWMKENLRTTKYADGTSIEQGSTYSYDVAYWYYPNNDILNMATYGLLYNWKAVMYNSSSSDANPSNVQGICPTGWHVPSDAEWTQLTDYVSTKCQYICGPDSEYIAKALADTTGWNTASDFCEVGNVQSDNNATGFSVLPAGQYSGGFFGFGTYTWFWSATENNGGSAYFRNLSNAGTVYRNNGAKRNGFSVRCIRD